MVIDTMWIVSCYSSQSNIVTALTRCKKAILCTNEYMTSTFSFDQALSTFGNHLAVF